MTGEPLAGRYQLEQELGRGGMATVFLATDLRLSRQVAVKVMHPGGDGRRAERFRQEAALVASLKHPNVLEIHDFGEDAARGPFLVCEWVQGEDLRELARRLSPVPPEVAAVLGWELARALGAAHARGVVHRDVKPENVLVARGGPLKLADFGIAALADQERLTSTGAITGSLAYMAPERIDTGAFSPASDVYAVGVVLFELCAGSTPHGGKGAAYLAASVMTKDAPPLASAVPGTPEPLNVLVARCLARDSRDRPTNGEELARMLEDVVGRIAGPPAEETRAFFQAPEAYAARWREARFQRLLSEGGSLLAQGEGARAARVLNEALALRPDSPEVMALLRARPKARRSTALGVGAALAGLVAVVGVVGWGAHPWRTPPRPPEETSAQGAEERVIAEPVPARDPETDTPKALPRETASSAPAGVAPVRMTAPTRTEGARGARAPTQGATSGSHLPQHPLDETPPESTPPAPSGSPDGAAASATGAPLAGEPVKPATLRVTTRPWAEVFVDDQSRGYTPRVREVNLSPGTHRLRFVNPLCDAWEEVIQVAAGELVSREVKLQVRKAEMVIVAPAGARVFVDGVEAGVAPLPGPVNVEHGSHVISARAPGVAALQREVDVVAGKRIEVVLEVAP
ncbi:serine/threonine-protein kinase [Vitiosangium sp. GDMCC 1.1324]|uniref:serine/threonine-protein kinase n=1 Tax=Vitiosangium sp. (strain GDMCC 1.1324) TaxID=2138576 RepID=UPI000D38AD50|nr:serine/threonine-protein kinase [Vitiosangium sp. GDMCC 1.1324]PTL80184.1 protein kinase [Vitiosangium sp. GDMCC 1.1324]